MNNKIFENTFLCNLCTGTLKFELNKNNSSLVCQKCKNELKNSDGIFTFENNANKNLNKEMYNIFWKDIEKEELECKTYPLESELLNKNNTLMKNKIVLDAGVGDGRHLEIIARQNPRGIVCVDSSDSIYLAKKRWEKQKYNIPIIFIRSNVENLNFNKGAIDCIFCTGVITVAENYMSIISYFLRNSKTSIILGLLSKNIFGRIYYALNPLKFIFRKLKKYRLLFFILLPMSFLFLIFNLILMIKNSLNRIKKKKKYELSLFKIFSLIQEPFISPKVNKIDEKNLVNIFQKNGFYKKSTIQEFLISYMVFEKI